MAWTNCTCQVLSDKLHIPTWKAQLTVGSVSGLSRYCISTVNTSAVFSFATERHVKHKESHSGLSSAALTVYCCRTYLPGLLPRAIRASRAHFWTLPQRTMCLDSSPEPAGGDMPLASFRTDRTAVTIWPGGQGRMSEGWWENRDSVLVCNIWVLKSKWMTCCAHHECNLRRVCQTDIDEEDTRAFTLQLIRHGKPLIFFCTENK